jgi:hypothetical protein
MRELDAAPALFSTILAVHKSRFKLAVSGQNQIHLLRVLTDDGIAGAHCSAGRSGANVVTAAVRELLARC